MCKSVKNFCFDFCFVSFTGSLLANLNHNNLKYGTEISRTPSFMQGAMTPLTASPNKNLGPEKIILLVCNRACSGHQGKRYCSLVVYVLLFKLVLCLMTVLHIVFSPVLVNEDLRRHYIRIFSYPK